MLLTCHIKKALCDYSLLISPTPSLSSYFLLLPTAGQVTNDTVIGDPLFTVPISPDGQSLCYEIHGQANTIFNLVSDVCTSINANYTAMNIPENGNIISQIGVLAKPNAGQCKNVRVELEGCRAFIDDVEVIGVRNEEGVAVRRMRNRVRISVPNCDNLNLVMWVMCQNNSGQPMIRFVITRGLNLRPSSHGLLGMSPQMNRQTYSQ